MYSFYFIRRYRLNGFIMHIAAWYYLLGRQAVDVALKYLSSAHAQTPDTHLASDAIQRSFDLQVPLNGISAVKKCLS